MRRGMKLENLLFTVLVGAVMVAAVWIASAWPTRASIAILVLGSLGLVLAVWQFVLDVKKPSDLRERSRFEAPMAAAETPWSNLEIWSWIAGFFLLIHIFGFPVAAPLFVLAYTKFYGARWRLAIGLSVLAWSFVYGVFDQILHVPWPEPLVHYLFRP